MNFTNFSFWWLLILTLLPMLLVRTCALKFKLWRYEFDKVLLAFLSLFLFLHAAKQSFIIFAFELIINYFAVSFLRSRHSRYSNFFAIFVIFINVSILLFYKYLNFFAHDVFGFVFKILAFSPDNFLFNAAGDIPPGISFYTFQMTAFVVDSLKSDNHEKLGFIDYVNFTSFFPQIVAGPIERGSSLLTQVQKFKFRWNAQNFNQGMVWLSLGLFMKLVLGDNLANHINLLEVSNAWFIWLSIFIFSLRIYFDFAGYSFIALGLAKLLGIQLTFNFAAPYISKSIQEFWRRWHITLSEWLRDYVFIPLGGSRNGRTSANILAVFLISGLWHGAGWNFIIWGLYHGCLLVIHRKFGKLLLNNAFCSWALTFLSVSFGWLFFMETDLDRLSMKLSSIFSVSSYSLDSLKEAILLVNDKAGLLFTLSLSIALLLLEHIASFSNRQAVYRLLLTPISGLTLMGLTILLAARTSSQFVYFAF